MECNIVCKKRELKIRSDDPMKTQRIWDEKNKNMTESAFFKKPFKRF